MKQPRYLWILLIALVILGGLAWKAAAYFALPEIVADLTHGSNVFSGLVSQPSDSSRASADKESVAWKVETVAENLKVPWGLVFPTDSSVMFTERAGTVRLIENGSLRSEPIYNFSEVRSNQEQGLMGLTLHPDYAANGYVYVCVSLPAEGSYKVKVARLKAENPDSPTTLTFDGDILTGIQAAQVHAGCSVAFGPDEKLYVGTGDGTQKGLAKDQNSLVGKILRLNDDGSRPSDNPFADSLTYTRGHRNPQGLAWHRNGSLYSAEHGPSVFDGPAGGDEVNRILPGEYYGWPDVSHEKTIDGARSPIALYTPAEAPSGLMAYSGKMFPQFADNLFFGALKGTSLWRLELDPSDPDKILKQEQLFDGEYGRLRSVAEAPDGSIYFSTSNQDGRGKPTSGDDKILRIIKK